MTRVASFMNLHLEPTVDKEEQVKAGGNRFFQKAHDNPHKRTGTKTLAALLLLVSSRIGTSGNADRSKPNRVRDKLLDWLANSNTCAPHQVLFRWQQPPFDKYRAGNRQTAL